VTLTPPAADTTPAPIGRRLVDVSSLPKFAFGHRDPLWWGVWLLICIEGTMFVMLAASYVYLRGNSSQWPPAGAANAPLAVTASTVALLLISIIPTAIAFRAALDGRLRVIQLNMVLVTLISIAAAGTRWLELTSIGYNWNSHAYGSVVWGFYFMHTFHLVSGVFENLVFTALLFIGPVEKKHMVDMRLSAIYWLFVVVAWTLLWGLFTFDSLLFRNSIIS